VQFSEGMNNSQTAGEIFPPNVSISGSYFYENNFTIDGINNNSSIEPARDEIFETSILTGHPQRTFLDPHLIEKITVFDSNISAEHGGFTGGQVEVTTHDPVDEFWGNVNYRTTRDTWTKFYIDPDNQDRFYNSNSSTNQPHFHKHDAGATINLPIGNNMGILASYQILTSSIPLQHLGESQSQNRISENFFLKFGYHLSNKTRIFITGMSSPTSGDYFYPDVKGSDFSLHNNYRSLTAKVEQDFLLGNFDVSLSYGNHENYRRAPKDRFRWQTIGSIDWGGPSTSFEGAYGNIDQFDKDLQLNANFLISEFNLGNSKHLTKIGTQINNSKQNYSREETSYFYDLPSTNGGLPIICATNDPACITDEQYLTRRQLYEKGDSSVELLTVAAYIQDSIVWKRLEIFPGLRVSHDEYLYNTNVAPRFSSSYDLMGDGTTILFGGKNRYYSGTLLSYKLREAISPSGKSEIRGITGNVPDSDWVSSNSGNNVYRESAVRTPYSDEVTVGLTQKLFGGELKAQYIKRKGRDELTRTLTDTQPDGLKYYVFNNNGRSEHESYQLSWQRTWRQHYLELNGTYQETKSSHLTYGDTISDKDTTDLIWYNGEFISYDQIPKEDFNRPIVANLIYSGMLPFNIIFTNTTKFRGAYTKLTRMKPLSNHGVEPNSANAFDLIYDYEKIRMENSIVFDWRFAWKIPLTAVQNAVLTLDIYNVFNKKDFVSDNIDQFELGRQFWAGVAVNF
jgi:hypothetical protein